MNPVNRNVLERTPAMDGPAHQALDATRPEGALAMTRDGVHDLMAALRASGTNTADAIVQIAALVGTDAIAPLLEDMLEANTPSPEVLRALDGVALTDPAAANAWLNKGLSDGRIQEWAEPTWPKGFHLQERLWITSLPDGLTCEGDLYLYGCENLCRVPNGLSCGGDLNMNGCAIQAWPEKGVRVDGDASLAATHLTSLPADMGIGGAIDLSFCDALTAIPEGFRVSGTLNFEACGKLTSIPTGLKVGEGLCLVDCTALTSLPEDMDIGGELDLRGTAIVSLPRRLHANAIDLTACATWDGLIPQEIRVDDYVLTDAHPNGLVITPRPR